MTDFDIDALIFGTKVCPGCGIEKAANSEQFGVDRRGLDGLNLRCKACCSAAQKGRYAADPERFRAKRRASEARKAARG